MGKKKQKICHTDYDIELQTKKMSLGDNGWIYIKRFDTEKEAQKYIENLPESKRKDSRISKYERCGTY